MTTFGIAFYQSNISAEHTNLNEFILGQIVVPEVVLNLSDDFLLKRGGGGIIAAAAIRHRWLVLCIDHFVHLLYTRKIWKWYQYKNYQSSYIHQVIRVGVCSVSDPYSFFDTDPDPAF
jgi:hypothetical protein